VVRIAVVQRLARQLPPRRAAKTVKKERSRAPKAVSCKRKPLGRSAMHITPFCPSGSGSRLISAAGG